MSQSRTLASILHFDSLRGRYIYVVFSMFSIVISIAVLSQLAVQRSAREHNQKMMAKDHIEHAIQDFTLQQQLVKAKLPEFIILPDDRHVEALENSIKLLNESLAHFVEHKEIQTSNFFKLVSTELQQNVQAMYQAIDDIKYVRLDAEKTFPVTSIMLDQAPRNYTVLGVIDAILVEADHPDNVVSYAEANRLFTELRYTWVRLMSEFRLLVSIRFGIFTGDWRNAFNLRFKNTEQYMNGVRQVIARLEKMDNEDKLSFEASDGLVTISKAVNDSLKSYMKAIDILRTENWRQDLLLLNNRVQPAIDRVDESIIKLHDELEEFSSASMHNVQMIAKRLSNSLWYLGAGGVIIVFFGYLVFDRKIIKPIGDVARALRKEGEGENVILAINSSATEISDLSSAFIEMRKQVKETNLNLENLVSERTKSLEKARQEATRANEAKSLFLTSMSHELRTPLNAILGFTELLILEAEGKLDSEQMRQLQYVYNAGEHLLSLVNELLNFESIESGNIHMTIEPVDVCNIITDVVQMVGPSAAGSGVSIEYEQACQRTSIVSADAARLKQVLLNLLSNAIKYNRKNGNIIINTRSVGDMLEISVTDTGPGLTKEQQDQLFEPFNRLGHNSSLIEGTGIGLNIVKQFIELMSGKVSVSSEVGEGSVFRVTVPLFKDA